nr:hypothetical protein [Tanacetum cinerariifolium]
MTGNISYLTDFKEHDGVYVAFGGGAKGGKITGKGTIKTAYESQVLLNVPRKNNMYGFDMKNIVPQKDLTCLLAKATNDESMLWNMRLGHINFKNINKLVKDNLVRGLPSKCFKNDQTCVACLKGKQHKVSFKSKIQNSISQPLFMLHMDLFGPTYVSSIMHKKYCLVITDDFSRFTWVFFLETKDETSRILKSFITEIENLVEKKVKIIRCDNGTEFKNRVMNEFCEEKDSKLPTTFWAEALDTACYVQNRVLVVKPHFKTPYEMFKGRSPALSFMRPFGCHVTILNTLDQLGKFDGKSDEGIFVGYSTISKAFRVYNTRTRKVEKNLHITFLENKPMITGGGLEWLFDINALSKSMNYAPVPAGTNSNNFAGKGASFDAGRSSLETGPSQDYILMQLWKDNFVFDSSSQDSDRHNKDKHGPSQESECDNQKRPNAESSTKTVNTAGPSINTVKASDNTGSLNINIVTPPVNTATTTYADYLVDPFMPDLEDTGIFDDAYNDRDEGAEADYNNLETVISVSPIPSTRVHKDHPKEQIIGEVNQDLDDESWVEAMQEELLQFKLLNVWTLMDLPHGKRTIGTKWVFRNKRDQRGIVVRNKARLVAQGHRQEEGIDYDEVFALVARIEAIRLFLAYASFMDFTVYQMDVKSAFLYGTIEEEVYVSQTPGFVDPEFPDIVYKVEKALYGLHQAPKSWPDIMFVVCACSRFQVQPKVSHMHVVKRIFRYLKGQPTLGLWYPKDSPLDLIAYLIVIMQVPVLIEKLQQDVTKIHVDNESEICVVKNPIYHSKTKHIEIRHHFIRDSYERRLIEMEKIHTDYNVADLLTKAFDVTRFQFLIASIGLLNP